MNAWVEPGGGLIILTAETENACSLEASLELWRLQERSFTEKDGSHSESGLAASAFKPTVLPDGGQCIGLPRRMRS